MHIHLQMQSQAAHVPKIISGLNSAAATLSSLSVAVHTHTLSSCAVDNFLHVIATACFEVAISSWCMHRRKSQSVRAFIDLGCC